MKKCEPDLETLKKYAEEGLTDSEIGILLKVHRATAGKIMRRSGAREPRKKLLQPIKTNSFIGTKHGKLTVLSFSHYKHITSKRMYSYWNCICECGTKKVIDNAGLMSGSVKSCGCLQIEKLKELHKKNIKPDAPFYFVLKTYIRGAKDRNFTWDLTETEFREITSSDCYYCGESPSRMATSNGNQNFKGNLYTYNGIDRVDNNKGYEKDNIVPCCNTCNMLKGIYSQESFLSKVIEIYKHQTGLK